MDLYPELEPYDGGWLNVSDGHAVYWEVCGNPEGKPAVVLHGGPGAPGGPRHRRLFNPTHYRVVLLHQRNCGRSRPHASVPNADLKGNTTADLVEDLERLRMHLRIDDWLVLGGSWGSALGLAYAQAYPARVTELVLFSVFLGLRSEIDSVFRGGLGSRFQGPWDRLRAAVRAVRDEEVVEAAHRLLFNPDPTVHQRVAHEWCVWESSILEDPPSDVVRLLSLCADEKASLAFARIVTHYVLHNVWLDDGALLEGASRITDIPIILINGEQDPQTGRWIRELARSLPLAQVIWVPDAGHAARGQQGQQFLAEIIRATDHFATFRASSDQL